MAGKNPGPFYVQHPYKESMIGRATFLEAEKYARTVTKNQGARTVIQFQGKVLAQCNMDNDGKIWTDLTGNGTLLI